MSPLILVGLLTFELRSGYGTELSTGVSHLGFGEGLAVGHSFASGLHLELEGFHFDGSRTAAADSTEKYVASYQSYAIQAGAGWQLRAGPLVLRPGVELGSAFVMGRTTIGDVTVHDDVARLVFGPAFALVLPIRMVRFGIEAQGLFVTSDVAAPTFMTFASLGVDL